MDFLNAEILAKILAKEEGTSKITIRDWQVNNNIIAAGNNYSSEITRLTIQYEKEGQPFDRKYIFKLPSNSPIYNLGLRMKLYEKECTMYTQILPLLSQHNANVAPLYFYTGEKYSLILEDLSQSGYTLATRRDQLDFQQCRLVFTSLAKFHAFSVHLNESGKLPDSVKEHFIIANDADTVELFQFLQNSYANFIGKLEEPYKTKYSAKLTRMQSTVVEDFLNCLLADKGGFNCLAHGDCWITNMMFQYDEYGLVERMKFLDFQCSCWTSPVLDIIRFTISSMKFEVYERHFELLLDIYLETLNKILGHFNCGTYEKRDLMKDIEGKFLYTIATVIGVLPIVLADFKEDEYIDLEKAMKDKETSKQFIEKVTSGSYVTETVMKWFRHFADRGLLDD